MRSSPRTTFCLLSTCEKAHHISPHELVASSMVDKSARESQRRRGQSLDIKTVGLRTSEIPIPLLVSLAMTHRYHHRHALPFRDWYPFTKPVLIFKISSTFVPRCFPVLYPISRSGTQTSKSSPLSVGLFDVFPTLVVAHH